MSVDSMSDMLVTAVTGVVVLLFLYVAVTALPTFLGLAGPWALARIILARMVPVVVVVGIVIVLVQIAQR